MSYDTYNGYAEFTIRVKAGPEGIWHFSRRYSVIYQWNDMLKKRFGEVLPRFPPKTWCKSFNPEFLRERAKNLEIFFKSLLEIPEITRTELFLNFFQPKDSVFLMNPRFKNSSASEILDKVFRSTEGECSLIVQETIGKLMPMEDLPQPLDEYEVERRGKQCQGMISKLVMPTWENVLPKSFSPSSLPPASSFLWTNSKTKELENALTAVSIPKVDILVIV